VGGRGTLGVRGGLRRVGRFRWETSKGRLLH